MAHDKQYKDGARFEDAPVVVGNRYPRRGEWYWDRELHQVRQAKRNMTNKYLIIDRGKEKCK